VIRPVADIVVSNEAVPREVDVVIVGGGIIGASTALVLAERGQKVALCEKGRIAGEQSSRNWGWVRRMGRDPAELPLGVESLRLWADLNERVGAETGFRTTGISYLAETPDEMDGLERMHADARRHGVDTRLLTPAAAAELLPGLSRSVLGALHAPDDGRAEPTLATAAITRAAQRLGASVLTQCAVRGVETTGGRVTGVVTERGPIRADAVLLAGGAWSRLFAGNAGFDLPVLKLLSSVFRTQPLDGPPELAVGNGEFGFRKRLDGGYTIAHRGASQAEITPDSFRLFWTFLPAFRGQRRELRLHLGKMFFEELKTPRRWALDAKSPFEAVRVLDPEPSASILSQARARLVRAFPAFAPMVEAERWAGVIDATPDGVPIISAVAHRPGLYVATGFSGHGFGIGPGAGQLAADLITGSPPVSDPFPFRSCRFDKRPTEVEAQV
jgi:glycine/D-amino acid oxidase-like deaminating enzyme